MTVIYAHSRVDGLDGVYASPAGFKGGIEQGAETVITNDAEIKKAYSKIDGVTVKDFTDAQKKVLFKEKKKD